MADIQNLEHWRTEIEKMMLHLPENMDEHSHRMYLAGVIDTLYQFHQVNEEIRGQLYMEYAH